MKRKEMSLRDYHNSLKNGAEYLWVCGIGYPTGCDFRNNLEESESMEYCDLNEIIDQLGLWDLNGIVDQNNRWEWDGAGNPVDHQGNSILNIKAMP